jgi:hypothetical protein
MSNSASRRASPVALTAFLRPGALVGLALLGGTSGCVTENKTTGDGAARQPAL